MPTRLMTLVCVFLMVIETVSAQVVGDYRTRQDGSWTTLNTWERLNSVGPQVWAIPTGGQGYPGQMGTPGTVTILNTHDVALNFSPTIGILTIGGGASGTLTVGVTTNTNYTLTCSGAVTVNAGASLLSFADNDGAHIFAFQSSLNNAGTINFAASTEQVTLTVGGNTTNTGTMAFGVNTGIKTFTGDVNLNGGTWSETAAVVINYGGSLANAATFTASTGIHTFTGTTEILSGTMAIPNATFTGSYTNDGTLTVSTALSGGGSLTQGTTGTLNIGGSSGITTLDASQAGNTVNYTGAGQTAKVITYQNLTLSGSGTKTFATTPTVNGILSMEGTASVTVTGPGTAVMSYGPNATLQYNKPGPYNATTEEWITPFLATGGVIIRNVGVITSPAALQMGNNTNVPLTIQSGASLTGNGLITLHGDFVNAGTFSSAIGITLAGTTATQSIDGFTTSGVVSMTKTSGVATFQGNVNGGGLTLNGTGGTLNLGTGLTHTFGGLWTRTNGTLNGGSSLLRIGGNVTGTGGTFTGSAGTVDWSAAGNQTLASGVGVNYNNLVLSGSGSKTFTAATTIAGNLSITGTAVANLGTGLTHTANTLTLGGAGQPSGSHGSTGSAAVNKNNTYFLNTSSGIVNVAACSGGESWLGTTNTDWNTLSNWCYAIPTAATDVVILPVTNQPTIGAAGGSTRDITITPGATVTITGSNNLAVSGDWTNNGAFTPNTGTVTFNGTTNLAGTSATTFYNVSLATGTVTTANNLNVNLTNNLAIGAGSSFTHDGTNGNLTIGGTTLVAGTFSDGEDTGVDTFTGLVTVNAGGNFNTTAVTTTGNAIFRGGISNAGTFAAGTGTFNTNNQTLTTAGASTINFSDELTVAGGITVTNNGSVNTDELEGAGTWAQGATTSSVLTYGGATIGIANFNASGNGNTVHYDGSIAVQSIRAGTGGYHHLTLSGAITSKSAGGNFSVKGNFSKSGFISGFDANGSTVTFDGTAAQSITSNSALTFDNLVINNSFGTSPQITVNTSNIVVDNVLTMTRGNINLNGRTLTISSTAAGALVHGPTSATGWMYGGSIIRARPASISIAIGSDHSLFPLGSAGDWRPFLIGQNPHANTAGNITVSHTNGTGSSTVVGHAEGIVRTHNSSWTVTTTGLSAGPAWTLQAGGTTFGTIEAGAAGLADLRLYSTTRIVGTSAAATGGPDYRVNRINAAFNDPAPAGPLANIYRVGSVDGVNTPLPVSLLFFKAQLADDATKLTWATASELNNDFFTIERAADIEQFETIGAPIPGSGTTSERHTYYSTDETPLFGRSYYRLKQTDFDGKFTYSGIQVIDYEGPQFATLKAYPNPSNGNSLTLVISGLKDQSAVPVQIFNVQGQKVFEHVYDVTIPGTLKQTVEFGSPLGSGLYIIKAGQTLQLTQKLAIE